MAKRKRGRPKNPNARLNRQVGGRVRALQTALELFFASLEGEAEEVVESFADSADEMFAHIVARTPVKTGRLKRGWEIDRQVAIEQLKAQTEISNNTFYLRFVEFGSSKQAPKGFIRISLTEFKNNLVKALKKIARSA